MKQLNKSIYILAICMNSSIISTNSSPFRSFSQNKCLLHVTERKKGGRGANHFNNASHDIRITNKPPEASLLLVTNRSSRGRVSTVNYAEITQVVQDQHLHSQLQGWIAQPWGQASKHSTQCLEEAWSLGVWLTGAKQHTWSSKVQGLSWKFNEVLLRACVCNGTSEWGSKESCKHSGPHS